LALEQARHAGPRLREISYQRVADSGITTGEKAAEFATLFEVTNPAHHPR